MVTRAWRVYEAKGYRQRESFSKSYRWDFSDDMVGTRIIEVENSDRTGTNEYSILRITPDLTINIPQYSLDEGEAFLSADCPKLIAAMVKYGYLEITGKVKAKYGTYKVGRFTQKFVNEFEKTM